MKVAIMSPRLKQGLTTSALLMAQALAMGAKLDVVFTYTGKDYKALSQFTGFNAEDDKTRSSSQLIRLIETGSLRSSELLDYSFKVGSNLHILNTSSESTSAEDSETLVRYFLQDDDDQKFLKVIEVNTELDEAITQDVLHAADLILIVGDQTIQSANQFKKWQEFKDLAPDREKTCLVISRFDEFITPAREVARMYGIRYRRVSRISYNPFITKFANEERLTDLMSYVIKKNAGVFRLNGDLKDCSKLIGNNLGIRVDWGD